MISLPSSVRIYLAARPVDMRKGIDGLMGDVRGVLKGDPYSGHLFVFVGRRADRVKVLYWDRGGFVLTCKRLECGRFRVPPIGPGAQSVRMDSAELGMLLEGIDFSRVRRPVPWMPNASYRTGIGADVGEKLDRATDP